MARFKVVSPTRINPYLARAVDQVLGQNHDRINPTLVCSLQAFDRNIELLSSRLDISPAALVFSVKAMPVSELIDLAVSKKLRLLLYGLASIDELFGSNPSDQYISRTIVGDSDMDAQSATQLIMKTHAHQFLITRLDSYYTICHASNLPESYQLGFYALTGIPDLGRYWSNSRVIPIQELSSVVQPMIYTETRTTQFQGVFIYSGNPFTRDTRVALERALQIESFTPLLADRECLWGGLGRERDENDFELLRLMSRFPHTNHGVDAGTALVYDSSALVAKVRHYTYPLSADKGHLILEWGLAGGAHDIKYIYGSETLNVILVNRNGSMLEPTEGVSGPELIIVGESMASDDSSLGTLSLPKGVNKDDVGAIVFLDAQYVLTFELKRHILGGYHPVETVVL